MSERWTWSCQDAAGAVVADAAPGAFPTQAEAEAWLGEAWEDLADQGVAAVSLEVDEVVSYGPMPLAPA